MQKPTFRDFPGGPVVRTLSFHCQGHRVQSLVRELRSHKPCGVGKKQTKTKQSPKNKNKNKKQKNTYLRELPWGILCFLFVWFFKPTFLNLSKLCVSKRLLTKLLGLFLVFPNYKSTPMLLIHMNHSCYPLPFYRETYFCLKDISRANMFNSEYLDQASVWRRWYRIVKTTVNWSIWLWIKGESNCSSSADNCQARMLAQRCLIFQFHWTNHENLDFFVCFLDVMH